MGDDMPGMDGMDMGMGMVFKGGTYMGPLLFKFWKTDGTGLMVLACCIVLCFGIIRHMFGQLRQKYAKKFDAILEERKHDCCNHNHIDGAALGTDPSVNLMTESSTKTPVKLTTAESLRYRLGDGFFFGISLIFAYFNMLIAMTMNGWLFAAVIIGEAIGVCIFPGSLLNGCC